MTRVFSGIQPSGELHIGNYLGAVQNWVRLQTQHDCLFSIVDLHAITQPYDVGTLASLTLDMAVSLYAVGLDPEKCIVFVQSHVTEHTELNWLLTTVGLILGIAATYALNFLLVTHVSGVKMDWSYVAIGMVLLWANGLIATILPAMRGASVSPAVATRSV